MELSGAAPRRRKRRPMRVDRALLLSMGFIALFFTMLGLLYTSLDTEEERAGMVNALRKAHHSHRSLARTVRAALRLRKPPTPAISAPPSPTLPPAITPTARLSVTPTAHPTASVSSPHAPFTSILPRPQLFRWGAMAIAPLDEPLVDLVPLPLSRHQQPPPARERPAYLDKPSPELVPMPPPKPKSPRLRKLPSPRVGNSSQADKEDDSTALWASGTAITLGRPVATDEGEAMPPGSHAAQAAAGSQPAATQKLKPSERAKLRSQSFHLGQAKIDELLGRDVDPVLSNLLMEMRGSISCGGRPIMAFREYDELRAASDELASVLPESNDLAQRAGGRAGPTGGGGSLGRCAVVGNSGVLLDAVAGTAIDAHDTVIRFNAAPTKGFEAYVGSKTTIRIQNVDHLGFKEKQDMALVFSARTDKDVRKFIAHRKKYPGRAQYMFNPEFWCHVWDWVSRKKLKPSSGLAGLVLALHTCDMPVSLYGFRHNATTFHYFDKLPTKVTQEEVYWYHPLVEELAVMHELVALGKLTIF